MLTDEEGSGADEQRTDRGPGAGSEMIALTGSPTAQRSCYQISHLTSVFYGNRIADPLTGSPAGDMIYFVPKSFENGILARQALSQSLLQSVRLVGEYRGKEALFSQQSPQVLQALRESALIQSTESSNRIEGVVAPAQRIRDLVAKRTEPANRSEQEIAGYRDVLNTIHSHFADMQLTSNLVQQLHRDLFQFVPGGGDAGNRPTTTSPKPGRTERRSSASSRSRRTSFPMR